MRTRPAIRSPSSRTRHTAAPDTTASRKSASGITLVASASRNISTRAACAASARAPSSATHPQPTGSGSGVSGAGADPGRRIVERVVQRARTPRRAARGPPPSAGSSASLQDDVQRAALTGAGERDRRLDDQPHERRRGDRRADAERLQNGRVGPVADAVDDGRDQSHAVAVFDRDHAGRIAGQLQQEARVLVAAVRGAERDDRVRVAGVERQAAQRSRQTAATSRLRCYGASSVQSISLSRGIVQVRPAAAERPDRARARDRRAASRPGAPRSSTPGSSRSTRRPARNRRGRCRRRRDSSAAPPRSASAGRPGSWRSSRRRK